MGRFDGQVAWVTGASRGIGRAVALALAGEGAAVALTARDERDLEAVRATISARGGRALVAAADVSDAGAVADAHRQVAQALGPVDLMVNNAAVLQPAPALRARPADVDRMWRVNVLGVIHCTQASVPAMVERHRGRVVNVSSVLGARVMPLYAGYCATKWALMAFSDTLRVELRGTGVSVTVVLPTGTDTDMNRHPDLPERVRARARAGRYMSPEAVADALLLGAWRRDRTVWCSRRSHALALAARALPDLADRWMARSGERG